MAQTQRVNERFEYEAFCPEHGVTEHVFGTCLKCAPEWLRPRRRESPNVTPANRITRVPG